MFHAKSRQTSLFCFSASGRQGFTLVELLVVIGIISVLISLLLPSLNKARQAANTVQCASNMRQLAQANTMWSNERGGYSIKAYFNAGPITGDWWTAPFGEPIGGTPSWYLDSNDTAWCADWYSALNTRYLRAKKLFLCPNDTSGYSYKNTEFGGWPPETDPLFGNVCNFPGSYRINYSNQPAYAEAYKVAKLRGAAETIVFAEGAPNRSAWDYYQGLSTWNIGNEDSVGPNTPSNVAFKRHGGQNVKNGRANYAFLDGHVEGMSFNDTWKGYDASLPQPVSYWRRLYVRNYQGNLISGANP